MSKKFKRLLGVIVAAAVALTAVSPVNVFAGADLEENTSVFDPETVMWTNDPVENVLAEDGVYKTLKEVNPNASNKVKTEVQTPYGKPGEVLDGWAYSEYIWTHSYPVGNGRMAAMVGGGIDNEVIQINEDTCWDGSPYGTLKNEKGETITKLSQTNAAQTITTENQTSGSKEGSWRLKGIATREGVDLDLKWADGVPTEAKFYANQSGPINVRSKYVSEVYVYDENGIQVETSLNDDRNLVTFEAEAGKTYTMSNFGSGVLEGDLTYPASNVTEFYASDGGSLPKASSSGIGYMYNRENVKVGYAVDYFDFNGLQTATLNMASVRQDNTYLTITLETPIGTEIAKQLIKTGDNVIEFKNLDGVTGKHKIWLLYTVEPYNSSQKYIGDASDLTASYKKSPIKPNPYIYAITSTVADGGKISADITYNSEGEAPGAVLIAAAYDKSGALSDYGEAAVNGTQNVTVDCAVPEDGSVKVYIWDSLDNMQPLSATVQVKN